MVPSNLIAMIFEVFLSAFSGAPSSLSEQWELHVWPPTLAKIVLFPYPRRGQNSQGN